MKVKILLPLLSFCLMMLTSLTSSAQTAAIRGMISLSTNEAADNVSVTLKGTRIGTTTDAQGNYEIKNVKPGTYTIKVSAVGFSSKEKSIMIGDDFDADVNGALNAGMDAIFFNIRNIETPKNYKQINHLLELKSFL